MTKKNLAQEMKIDSLTVQTHGTTEAMGKAAEEFVARKIQAVLNTKGHANLLLATGSSQFTFLNALKIDDSLDWSKIAVFHLDEYIGISPNHPASFRNYLHERIIDEVKPGKAYFLDGDAKDIQAELERYQELLESHPIDIACIGIGENGHLAFNDPPVADFEDPQWVKVVELDEKSRQQQVDEGWFNDIEEVPTQALSLTIPAIMRSKIISCVVPDRRKAEAIRNTINSPVTTDCPASILRTHSNTVLFLDADSASELENVKN